MNKILIVLICLGVVYGFSKSSNTSKTFVYNGVDTFINKTSSGSATTLLVSKGGYRADSALVLPPIIYADTTTANFTKSAGYNGSLIMVGTDVYYRTLSPLKWNKVNASAASLVSISQGYGITATPNPITNTGTVAGDTTKLIPFTDTLKTYGVLTRAKGDALYASSGSGVSSVTGTANQITASPLTGAVVIGLPTNVIVSGTLSGTGLISTGQITATGTVIGSILSSTSYVKTDSIVSTNVRYSGNMTVNNGFNYLLRKSDGSVANAISLYVDSLQIGSTTNPSLLQGSVIKARAGTHTIDFPAKDGTIILSTDTSSMLSNRLKISDTATMLSGYARSGNLAQYWSRSGTTLSPATSTDSVKLSTLLSANDGRFGDAKDNSPYNASTGRLQLASQTDALFVIGFAANHTAPYNTEGAMLFNDTYHPTDGVGHKAGVISANRGSLATNLWYKINAHATYDSSGTSKDKYGWVYYANNGLALNPPSEDTILAPGLGNTKAFGDFYTTPTGSKNGDMYSSGKIRATGGEVQSTSGINAILDGSNAYSSGGYVRWSNTAITNGWLRQYNASNGLSMWWNNGVTQSVKQTIDTSGNTTQVGTLQVGTMATGSSSDSLVVTSGNGLIKRIANNVVANSFFNGGNSFGTNTSFGTNDNNNLTFRTNNTNQLTLNTSGTLTNLNTTSSINNWILGGDGSASFAANGVTITTAGQFTAMTSQINGTLTVVGTAIANIFSATTLTGTVSTATQPNITSVGTLSALTISGSLQSGSNTLLANTGYALTSIGNYPFSRLAKLGVIYSDAIQNGVQIDESTGGSGTSFILFRTAGSAIGSITRNAATSAVLYNTTSDTTLKKNIVPSQTATDLLMKIPIISYDWKKGGSHVRYGQGAQLTYKVFPESVTVGGMKKGEYQPWQIDYQSQIPLIIKTVQEQQLTIDNLRSQLDELKAILQRNNIK